jgi:hypothetical protein
VDDDMLHLTGPWVLGHESGRNLTAGEIAYADVLALRDALRALGLTPLAPAPA